MDSPHWNWEEGPKQFQGPSGPKEGSHSLQANDHYEYEDALILKSKTNGIKMWSLVLDVRNDPEGQAREYQVLFHYTNEKALDVSPRC